MEKLQESIGTWGVETFNHTFDHLPAIHAHLKREVDELQHEIETTPENWGTDQIAEECADVFILLCSIAHVCGFSLREHAGRKMAINRSRTWGEPDEDGCIEHVANVGHELRPKQPKD